LNILS
jgi:hypothetical protein